MSSCPSSHIWCYATVCRLALPHIYVATLLYVVLHFLTYMMLRYCMSSCTSSHIWCYATVCRLALPHIYDATLLYVVLHFLTDMMLRYCMSSCTSSQIWCYATVCRLALPHIHDATLLYVVLHFLTYMMLPYCMSSCTSSHIWCYATVCRLALPHRYDATLLCGVGWGGVITFICTSSHIWCYVIVWGGVGWGNNVHLHFLTYMMLRYCMSSCTSSQIWCYVRQSLGPITPIASLEELKQLFKQWGKKGYEVLLRSSLEQCKMRNVQKTLSFLLKIPCRATAVYQACT